MTEIKDLTEATALAGNDQLPVYSVANAATRKATVDQVTAYVRDAFGLDVQNLNFGLRSDAVTAIVALQGLLEGQVFTAAGLSYLRRYGATEIADMPGFVPGGTESPGHWNAAMNGTTDDSAALQAMVNYAGRIIIPDGKTVRVAQTIAIPAGLTELNISSGRGGKVFWDPATAINFLSFTNYAATYLEKMVVRGFEIVGNHATNLTYINSYPMLVTNVKNVQLDGCKVSYSRVMGIAVRGAEFASARGCEVHHCARDGINFEWCTETVIADNHVHHCDDDAIAVHNAKYSWQRGHTVTGNNISHGSGIHALGVNNITIAGNSIQFFIKHAIDVSAEQYSGIANSGVKPSFGIVITGNSISDAFNRLFLDALNGGATYIALNLDSAQPGTLTYIPGTRGTTPYGYLGNVDDIAEMATTTPIPESGDIVISNNVMKRTLPRTGNFSDQGFGKFWLRDGEYDYALSSATAASFLRISGNIRNLVVSGNVCSGEDTWASFVAVSGTMRQIRNMKVCNNIVSDIRTYAVSFVSSTETFDIEFFGNTFDLDPYHIHSNRASNGSWLVAANLPQVLLRQGTLGLSFRDNDFKNVCRFGEAAIGSQVQVGNYGFAQNRVWADPAANGFSTSNKGVGEIPTVSLTTLVHIECDPASANFGKIYRPAGFRASSVPVSGTFMTGEYVEKSTYAVAGAAASKYVIRGWMRLTTGTAHVVDTDWAECRTLTGT